MIQIKKYPPSIHPAYNPVIFGLAGTPNSVSTLCVESNGIKLELDIDFPNNGLSDIDLSGIIKSLFAAKPSDSDDMFVVDNFLSISYRLRNANNNGGNELGIFRTLRSAAQISETQNYNQLKDRILTGFDKLIVYDNPMYRRDVSILASGGYYKGRKLEANRVNRIYLSCADTEISAIDNGQQSLTTCSGLWSDFVCMMQIGSDNNAAATGNALACKLTYAMYKGANLISEMNYDVLSAVEPVISLEQWRLFTVEQALQRANNLLGTIVKCGAFTEKNSVVEINSINCSNIEVIGSNEAYIDFGQNTFIQAN
jgi:hypothetical protein